jgi:hypothetical protein
VELKMSESLPVLVIVTSNDCPACRSLHRTGDFNRDSEASGPSMATFFGSKWDANFFIALITGKANPTPQDKPVFRVYELELVTMNMNNFTAITPNKDASRVLSFTEFILGTNRHNEVVVTRHTYYIYTDQDTQTLDGTLYLKDATKIADGERINKSFYSMITKTFPTRLSSLLHQYPSFLWFNNTEWNRALLDPTYTPYGAIFGLVIGEKEAEGKKSWGVISRDGDLGENKKTPVLLGQYIASHLNVLTPPKSASEVKTEPPKIIEINNTIRNKSKSSTLCTPAKVRIVFYISINLY